MSKLAPVTLGLAMFLGSIPVAAAHPAPLDAPLSADASRRDVRVLVDVLRALHPALTKYRTRDEIDEAFRHFERRGGAARSSSAMFLAASELAAAIRCGHTWTNGLNQAPNVRALLEDAPNKLPFELALVEGRWLVLASADPAVERGDEVLAIAGIDAGEMVAMLLPYLRADGSSDGKRLRQLSHDRLDDSQMDVLWPLVAPPVDGRYELDLRTSGGATRHVAVAATTTAARSTALLAQGLSPRDARWSFVKESDDLAVLRLPTFAFWDNDFDWRGALRGWFAELVEERVANLVVDLRDNEGGSGEIGPVLLSYLLDSPYILPGRGAVSAYERVPYRLARFLDTWDFDFFDRTGQVAPIIEGPQAGKYLFLSAVEEDRTVQPDPLHYSGQVFVLVGAENSSASFVFARMVQQSGVGTLVGQRTGGNLRGLNGGELLWVTLPGSGVAVDVPLLASTYDETTPDDSIHPDVDVVRTFDAQRAGIDQEMVAVRALLSSGR